MTTSNIVSDHGLECIRKSTQLHGDTNDPIYVQNSKITNTPTVNIGSQPISTSSNITNTQVPIYFYDPMVRDMFGRLRTSAPETRFDGSFSRSINNLIYTTSTATSGTVTYDNDKKAAILTCTGTTGSKAVLATRQYIKYHPGKSNLIKITGNIKGAVTNIRKRWGQFDDNNGFYYELNGSTLSTVIRSKCSGSVVNTPITNSSWYDKLDGAGLSSMNLNTAKQNIYFFEYQWLGTGACFFGASWNQALYIASKHFHANLLDTLYSQTATLPLRFEIENLNSGSSATLEATCMTVISEGGQHKEGLSRTVNTGSTGINITGAAGTTKPLLSVRVKSASYGVPVNIQNIKVFMGSADNVLVTIYYNPTLTGASWVSGGTNAHIEYDISATALTGGEAIYSEYLSGSSGSGVINIEDILDRSSNSTLGFDLSGTCDILTVHITNMTTNTTVSANINYIELLN